MKLNLKHSYTWLEIKRAFMEKREKDDHVLALILHCHGITRRLLVLSTESSKPPYQEHLANKVREFSKTGYLQKRDIRKVVYFGGPIARLVATLLKLDEAMGRDSIEYVFATLMDKQ